MKCHLIFHFCLNDESVWPEKHIKKLHENISIFNGNKFYSICEINNDIKSLEKNKNLKFILNNLVDDNTTVRYFLNDVNTKESIPFFDFSLPSLSHICSSDDYAFYGHTKGAGYTKSTNAINAWNTTLWKYNIENFKKSIQPNFKSYKTLGCLRKIEEKVGNKINDNVLESFHFSGTFFWFSCSVFNNIFWKEHSRQPHAIERWLGKICHYLESYSEFDLGESLNYYNDKFWEQHNIKGEM